MWGSTLTDANTLTNFNFGFSTHKSDILLHLSQWQYWWWFWFSLFWTVYFFIIIRLINKRTFTYNPVLNTSIRGHGKWGDFLVALIPLSWCGNILVNSNFILRMIEWQNESSLFTIRVQGKQWYWVYKFDAGAASSILTAPKNIGNNRWLVLTPQESYCADSYYQALHLGVQLEFKGLYYKYIHEDGLSQKNLNKNTLNNVSELSTRLIKQGNSWPNKYFNQDLFFDRYYPKKSAAKMNTNVFSRVARSNLKNSNLNIFKTDLILPNYYYSFVNIYQHNNQLAEYSQYKANKSTTYYDYDQLDDLSNFAANLAQQNNNKPIIFLKGLLNKHNLELLKKNVNFEKLTNNSWLNLEYKSIKKIIKTVKTKWTAPVKQYTHQEMLARANDRLGTFKRQLRLEKIKSLALVKNKLKLINISLKTKLSNIKNDSSYTITNEFLKKDENNLIKKTILFNILFQNNNKTVEKIEDSELFWGYRQKKYKRFKKFIFNEGVTYDSNTLEPLGKNTPKARLLKNTLVKSFNYNNDDKNMHYHNAIKYNRHRGELVPVNLARRLLRTKRTLVLPAHVNITLISNSYDVVHSWFIPGLGLKIDCVPGRSTHHSFYIDNVGFYYGQCAEICGRYHHHMPIRLCALNFEHFLVWWQKKGLRRLHRFSLLTDKKYKKPLFLSSYNGALMK